MASVLTIDDSALTRRKVSKILKAHGIEVLEAKNGAEGLACIQDCQVDCILLDLVMPDLSGWEVLKTLHERGSQIPVVVVTADLQSTTRQRCLDLGAVAIVHKLPKEDILITAIQSALTTRQPG